MAVRNLKNGTLVIKDGSATPKTLTVPIMDGDLEFEERKEAQTVLNRGVLKEFTDGPEEPVAISFSFTFEEWRGKTTSGAAASPADTLRKRGNASTWTSTLASGPYSVDLQFTLADVEASGGQNEVMTFADFHADSLRFREGPDANRVEVTGKALVTTPSIARS